MKVQLLCVFLCTFCLHIDQIRADELVTYYWDADYRGYSFTLNLASGSCVDLEMFDNEISSINTHGNCVILYDAHHCQGDTRTVEPGSPNHKYLGEVGFNDRARSLRKC